MQNFFMSDFHRLPWRSVHLLVLSVDIPWDIGNFQAPLSLPNQEYVNRIKFMLLYRDERGEC